MCRPRAGAVGPFATTSAERNKKSTRTIQEKDTNIVVFVSCQLNIADDELIIIFVLYTVDLISLIESHDLSTHLYADDTQVYGSCRPADVVSFSASLSRCADETSSWMKSNRLQSNPDKAEVLWCATTTTTTTTTV